MKELAKAGGATDEIFRLLEGEAVERMWVRIEEVQPHGYVGVLDSEPQSTDAIGLGTRVEFAADHVIQNQRNAS